MRTLVLAVAALLIAALSLPAITSVSEVRGEDRFVFQIDMSGEETVPPVDTVAWGFLRFFFNDDRSEADYTVDVKTLSGSLIAGADIHRGVRGANGPVVHHLADAGFIVTGGHLSLSRADLLEMAAGDWYVSVKTYANPEGEMRGQIIVPAGFLPDQPTPTPTRTPTPATSPSPTPRGGPTGTSTPSTATTPQTGTGSSIKPPNTGNGGLRGANDGPPLLTLAGLAATAALLVAAPVRRRRAAPPPPRA